MLLIRKCYDIYKRIHKALIFSTIRIMAKNCEFQYENTFVMKITILSHCAKSKV